MIRGSPARSNRLPGLRVPGAFDGFEMAARAILGQRVSVRSATTLAGRVAGRFGEPIETPFPGLDRLSPAADRLAEADGRELSAMGIAPPRAAAIIAIARAVSRRDLDLQPGPDPEAAVAALQEYPGLGDWTAQYIAMRALRWPDAFPAADLGSAQGRRRRLGPAAPRCGRGLATLAFLCGDVSLEQRQLSPSPSEDSHD